MTLKIRVVDAFIPHQITESILQEPSQLDGGRLHHERKMLSVAAMLLKLLKETIKRFQRSQMKGFDAEPGDRACHLRELVLRALMFLPALREEITGFEPRCREAIRRVNDRKSQNALGNVGGDAAGFFGREVGSIEISKEFSFLAHCRLLTIIKGYSQTLPNGIRLPKTYSSSLSKLSRNILGYFGEFANDLLGNAGAKLSQDSLELLNRESAELPCSPLTRRMLTVVRLNQPEGEYQKKSFGCTFFQIEPLFLQLRMRRAVVAIQTIVVSGTPQVVLFQFNGLEEQREFSRLRARDVRAMPREMLITVFQGVIPSLERCVLAIEKFGFFELVRVCAAQEDTFEPHSTLNDVADVEAREAIEHFRSKAPAMKCVKDKNPVILLWHVFLCSRQELLPDPSQPRKSV
jgi:hypothetical protein